MLNIENFYNKGSPPTAFFAATPWVIQVRTDLITSYFHLADLTWYDRTIKGLLITQLYSWTAQICGVKNDNLQIVISRDTVISV